MIRLIKYLCGTCHAKLRLQGQRTLQATLGFIVDSDDASDLDHRRSLGTVITFLGEYFDRNGPERVVGNIAVINWKQFWSLHVATGSMLSEIYSFASANREAKFLRSFMHELGFPQEEATKVYSDCSSGLTVLAGEHPARFKGTKHLDRRILDSQQSHQLGIIYGLFCPSHLNCADLGSTYKDKHNYFAQRKVLHGYEIPPPTIPAKMDTQKKRERADEFDPDTLLAKRAETLAKRAETHSLKPIAFNQHHPVFSIRSICSFKDNLGREWKSVGSFYQAARIASHVTSPELEDQIRRCDALSAVHVSSHYETRADWCIIKDEAMFTATMAKFLYSRRLRKALLATHPRRLIDKSHDDYWGSGKGGNGMNANGELLVKVRKALMDMESK